MKKLLLHSAFWCLNVAIAQNLVKNSSFEEYRECPNTLGTFSKHVTSWFTPTDGSTDYFNTCSEVMSAPENFNGIQHPKDGEAYCGLYFYAPADYREYIQVALKNTLQPGIKYDLSFYISLAEGSDFAVKDFGVVCSNKRIAIATKKELSKGRLYSIEGNKFHSFEINQTLFHENKSDWLKISTSFIAKGYEQYLLLGNLRNNKSTRKVQTKRRESKKGAYYYVDMVSLTTKEGKPKPEFELEVVHQFKNVLFDLDKFKLTIASKNQINKLINVLKEEPDLQITINGHTDNQGTEAYNLKLSNNRAKSIVDYLVASGLSEKRIIYKGYGSKLPIADNTTAKGQKLNRRVEFILK